MASPTPIKPTPSQQSEYSASALEYQSSVSSAAFYTPEARSASLPDDDDEEAFSQPSSVAAKNALHKAATLHADTRTRHVERRSLRNSNDMQRPTTVPPMTLDIHHGEDHSDHDIPTPNPWNQEEYEPLDIAHIHFPEPGDTPPSFPQPYHHQHYASTSSAAETLHEPHYPSVAPSFPEVLTKDSHHQAEDVYIDTNYGDGPPLPVPEHHSPTDPPAFPSSPPHTMPSPTPGGPNTIHQFSSAPLMPVAEREEGHDHPSNFIDDHEPVPSGPAPPSIPPASPIFTTTSSQFEQQSQSSASLQSEQQPSFPSPVNVLQAQHSSNQHLPAVGDQQTTYTAPSKPQSFSNNSALFTTPSLSQFPQQYKPPSQAANVSGTNPPAPLSQSSTTTPVQVHKPPTRPNQHSSLPGQPAVSTPAQENTPPPQSISSSGPNQPATPNNLPSKPQIVPPASKPPTTSSSQTRPSNPMSSQSVTFEQSQPPQTLTEEPIVPQKPAASSQKIESVPASNPKPSAQNGTTNAAQRPHLLPTKSQMETQYVNMLLALDDIPPLHNMMANFFTWILLAGFILFPGTFNSLQNLGDAGTVDPRLVNAVTHVPLFVVAWVCTGIGALGMVWFTWRWHKNYIWVLNKIFLPGCLNSLAGLLSTLANVFGVQHGQLVTTSKVTIIVTSAATGVCGLLTLVYTFWLVRRVKARHDREVGKERAGKFGEGVVDLSKIKEKKSV